MNEDTRLWFECTLGKKSHLNLLGKVVFLPLILCIGGTFIVFDFLFSKRIN